MACEEPVIGTDIVGMAEDIRSCDAGKIVEPKNVDSLADAILDIITNEALAEKMGLRGASWFRRNTPGR
jgi:glycosyltransferase involved in cell wall biosynthesis